MVGTPVRFPLLGPAYTVRSVDQSCQRLVNWYLENTEQGGTTQAAAYPTPGLKRVATIGDGPIRELFQYGEFVYVVSGASVYRLTAGLVPTLLGTLGTSVGYVGMACNGLQILIVDGDSGWLITLADGTMTEIEDPDFPKGATWCDFLDSYFVTGGVPGSQSFWYSSLLDGSQWNGLDFASAEGDPDPLIRGIVLQRQLFLYGGNSIEVWQNTGDNSNPIQRADNVFLESGIAGVAAVAKADNSLMWLARDERGDGVVYRAEGYTPIRVSTHAIEHALKGYARLDDAVMFAYQQEGHLFVVISFPSGDATWVYDVSTQTWAQRAWFDPLEGVLHRHRSNAFALFNRRALVGDFEDGRIYEFDLDTYTDDGGPIKRVRTTTAQDANLRMIRFDSLEVDIEHGVGPGDAPLDYVPKMMLRTSRDRGHTWSSTRTAPMGRVGEYNGMCRFNRLGASRGMVFELSCTELVKAILLGGVIRGTPGST